MRVLVTGAAGFIGAALSHRLLDRGDDVGLGRLVSRLLLLFLGVFSLLT